MTLKVTVQLLLLGIVIPLKLFVPVPAVTVFVEAPAQVPAAVCYLSGSLAQSGVRGLMLS